MSLRRGSLPSRLDIVGVVLVVTAIGWTYLVGAWPGSSPGSYAAIILAVAFALVIARLVSLIRETLVPAAIVVGAAWVAVTTPDLLSGTALGGPLGYANANGAFFVQAAMAGLILAAVSRATPVRIVGLLAAAAFSVVPFAAKSVTSATLLLVLPIGAVLAQALIGARAAIAGCGLLFIFALSTTIVVGSTYEDGDRSGLVDRLVDASLDERRAALWSEALVMVRENPVTGVGLGGFQWLSSTARSDRDARWAHNSFLQQGAETGLIGTILLVLLFVWGFVSLAASRTPNVPVVLGAAALAALGIHACVDYILHFPAVPIATAALVGSASATGARFDPGTSVP